jgi:hypothetical protein
VQEGPDCEDDGEENQEAHLSLHRWPQQWWRGGLLQSDRRGVGGIIALPARNRGSSLERWNVERWNVGAFPDCSP